MNEPEDHPDNVLRIERRFEAAPALVFALWTRPEFIGIWFGSSHGFRAEVAELDPRPGGIWRLVNRRGDLTEHPCGVYHQVLPGRRLVYSYRFAGTDFHSTVSVDLSPDGQGTVMRFCQTGFPDVIARNEHGFGWPVVFRLFERALLGTHGVGALVPELPQEHLDGVARDMQAAREAWEAERAALIRDVPE